MSRAPRTPHLVRSTVVAVIVSMVMTACAFGPQRVADGSNTDTLEISIIDEAGEPVPDASVEIIDTHGERISTTHPADGRGVVRLGLSDPTVAVVTALGYVDEPVVLTPGDDLAVRLWHRVDPQGRPRVAIHFGGDVMLGRRYLDRDRPTASAGDAASARRLVRHVAPLAERADLTMVNVEGTIGSLPDESAVAGRRVVIQSAPFIVDALDAMGVDVVTLGNDHAYDWGDDGVESTLVHLDEVGIGHVGAGLTAQDARRGRLDDVGGVTIGTISATTLSGDSINDELPDGAAAIPSDLPEDQAWRYEARRFGFVSAEVTIPALPRRIGDAWRRYVEVEQQLDADLDGDLIAELWAALTAVYPELQDWVARRGHGGAARHHSAWVGEEIARLRAEGADLVIVQLHGGYQFAKAPSAHVQDSARRALDDGADLVVGHHPNVLQGVEWHGDGLIAYSLGNLLFDHDLLPTFPGALLRVITDGSEILEARLLPVVLDRYRPKPLAGSSAVAVLTAIDGLTAGGGISERIDGHGLGTILEPDGLLSDGASAGTTAGTTSTSGTSIRVHGSSGVIERGRLAESWGATLVPGRTAALPQCALVRSDLLSEGVEVGVDVFGWGHFDKDAVSGRSRRSDRPDRNLPLAWRVPADPARRTIVPGRTGAPDDTALRLMTNPNSTTTLRLAANLDLVEHHAYGPDHTPLDPPATRTIELAVRRDRSEAPVVRFVTFRFDAAATPSSERIEGFELRLDVPDDGRWHDVTVDLPVELFEPDEHGRRPNKANLLIDAPPAVLGTLDLDDVRILEWRGRSSSNQPVWVAAERIRSAIGGALVDVGVIEDQVELTLSRC